MPHLLKLILISATFVLAGCATTVQLPASAEPKLEIGAAAKKHLVLFVQGTKMSMESNDWEQLRTAWRNAMSASAAAAGLSFGYQDSLPTLATETATLVIVTVNDYRYVSQGARLAVGIATGNAFINADVSFVELPTNAVAGTRKYSTTSSAGQGIFAPMTEKQIEAISNEILKEITQQ